MAMTVPIGGLSFLVIAIMFGELHELALFPMMAVAWLASQGIVHFVLGRYCNYKSNQLMGVNLTAPVVQLQVPFAMLLAVMMLHEKFTMLQAIGSTLMLGGSFITQSNAGTAKRRPLAATPDPTALSPEGPPTPESKPVFQPRGGLGLRVWSRRGGLLWQLTPDGARGLFASARRQNTGNGLTIAGFLFSTASACNPLHPCFT
jgi:uncharacterized membrane protein